MSAGDIQPGDVVPPAVGQFVVFDSGWSWRASYQAREIEKVTPKLLKLQRGGYPGRIERAKAIAYFDDREKALLICQSLAGVDGEFQRRRNAAEDECSRRVTAAREAKDKAVQSLLAKARGES